MDSSKLLAIRCEYRASGYSSDEMMRFAEELSQVGSVQFRPQGIPAAGASFDIGIIIQWMGGAIAGGIIGNAAYDLLKALAVRLKDFYVRKKELSGFPPDIYVLELRFDDFDLRIHGGRPENGFDCNFLEYSTLIHLPLIVQIVSERISLEPLSSIVPRIIDLHEPRISQDDADQIEFHFDLPWRIEGVIKCHYWSYHPETNLIEDGYVSSEIND